MSLRKRLFPISATVQCFSPYTCGKGSRSISLQTSVLVCTILDLCLIHRARAIPSSRDQYTCTFRTLQIHGDGMALCMNRIPARFFAELKDIHYRWCEMGSSGGTGLIERSWDMLEERGGVYHGCGSVWAQAAR